MPRIRFSPGLKPVESEQVAELMCYASGGLNTSLISLICSLPDIYRLLEKKRTQSPHIFLTGTPLKRTSLQAPLAENEACNVNELSLNFF